MKNIIRRVHVLETEIGLGHPEFMKCPPNATADEARRVLLANIRINKNRPTPKMQPDISMSLEEAKAIYCEAIRR